nr:GDSL esterase/lipase At5g33370-like [Ipomoea batatas]
MASSLGFGVAVFAALFLAMENNVVIAAAQGRAFFVFGDSLVDNGNNNFLATSARADSPPYGIDYPTHRPTGRFSNGLNIPDIISEKLGSEPLMPYLNPALSGRKLLVGANFASAGVGVLNDTGVQFVNIIRIPQQLDYFAQYQQRVSAIQGAKRTKKLVNEALVLITLGGNDFVNNYYLVPFSARSRQYPLPQYVTYVISEYKKVLRRLYNLGARRVIVTGTGPLGCVPAELAQHSRAGECATELQHAASLYNPQLVEMIKEINSEIGSDIFIGANTNQMHLDFINSPAAFGFVSSQVACCGQGPYNGVGLCTPLSNLCSNRDEYAFWDPFHPSERANRLIVDQIMNGSPDYMHPMNLSTILALDSNNL